MSLSTQQNYTKARPHKGPVQTRVALDSNDETTQPKSYPTLIVSEDLVVPKETLSSLTPHNVEHRSYEKENKDLHAQVEELRGKLEDLRVAKDVALAAKEDVIAAKHDEFSSKDWVLSGMNQIVDTADMCADLVDQKAGVIAPKNAVIATNDDTANAVKDAETRANDVSNAIWEKIKDMVAEDQAVEVYNVVVGEVRNVIVDLQLELQISNESLKKAVDHNDKKQRETEENTRSLFQDQIDDLVQENNNLKEQIKSLRGQNVVRAAEDECEPLGFF